MPENGSGVGEAGAGASRSGGERLFRLLLYAAVAVMAVELVLLVKQNRELKAEVGELREQVLAAQAPAPTLAEGEILGPLELAALDGGTAILDYAETDQDTILMIFSPSCPACNANMPNWKAIEERYPSSAEKRLVYVSTAGPDDTRTFAAEQDLQAPVLVSEDTALAAYSITHIPTTLVIAPGGTVKRVWVGVLPDGVVETL